MATEKKTRAKRGRPSNGLSETRVEIKSPALLAGAVSTRAKSLGISDSEAWRRAARLWVGWHETIPLADED